MFSVLGETVVIALAALPALVIIEKASSNPSLSPVLAFCIVCSGTLGVFFSLKSQAADRHHADRFCDEAYGGCTLQQLVDRQAESSSTRGHSDCVVVSSPSRLRHRPSDLSEGTGRITKADLKQRDSDDLLLQLALDGAADRRRDSSAPSNTCSVSTNAAAAAADDDAGSTAAARKIRSTNDGHRDCLHGEGSVGDKTATGSTSTDSALRSSTNNRSSSGRPSTTTATASTASPAVAVTRRSRATAMPSAPTGRRYRYHHHYRKGGEVLFIVEGVAQAAVGLVREPVRGAQADGAKGLVKGLGSGVFGVVLKPAKGIAKAGFNAFTGVRIGVSKAGRAVVGGGSGGGGGIGGGRREGSSGPPSSSKGEKDLSLGAASRQGNGRPSHSSDASARRRGGGLERLVPAHVVSVRGTDGDNVVNGVSITQGGPLLTNNVDAVGAPSGEGGMAAEGSASTLGVTVDVNAAGGREGRREVGRCSAGSGGSSRPPFDGLAVGVSTVPLVVSSVFLLAELARIGNSGGCDGGIGGEGRGHDEQESDVFSADYSPNGISGAAAFCGDGAELVAYLEVMLESSILCAVWEVLFAAQRAFRMSARKGSTLPLRILSSQAMRLFVVLVLCLRFCRRPLLPLWCAAVYDVVRRALDLHQGRQMRRLSLRPGEAAVLTQALVLWAADGFVYTAQELWVDEELSWEGMFPRAPSRSGSMVVVQTGVLGTLAAGFAVAVARALALAARRSPLPSWQNCILSYAVLACGTATWLSCWTAPLLRAHPVWWVVLYALGWSDPKAAAARAEQHVQSHIAEHAVDGWVSVGAARLGGAADWAWSELGNAAVEEVNVAGSGIDGSRPLLVFGWVLVLALGVPLVPWFSRRLSLSKIASRKVFHLLATVMFSPAIALEPEFLSLSLGAALGVMLALEFLRCAGCPPVAATLDRYYGGFLDARDGGCVVVTHLFLLVGCAVPVWLFGLTGNRCENAVLPYAGVIVVGVGDAMGAVVGSTVGRLHWPGSRRTLEGSASVFLATLVSLALVSCAPGGQGQGQGQRQGEAGEWKQMAASLAWPAALASLMEAFTSQVDNIILPCVLFSCLALREV